MGLIVEARDYFCQKPARYATMPFQLNREMAKRLQDRGIGSAEYADLNVSMCKDCPIGCDKRALRDAVKADSCPPDVPDDDSVIE